MMEEVLSQEEQELEALISLMEADDQTTRDEEGVTTGYGSEEEDYDRLFTEVMGQAEQLQPTKAPKAPPDEDVAMDTSVG